MSMTHNTSISSRAKGEWRIMPHPDHCNSPVTTRRMTEEEKQKYGFGRTDNMPEKLNISTETLLEECRVHGTNAAAAKAIGEKHGFTEKQVLNMIMNRKIKKKLKDDQTEPAHENLKPETLFEKLSEAVAGEVEALSKMGTETRITDIVPVSYRRMKPKTLIGQADDVEYDFDGEWLEIRVTNGTGQYLHIDWRDLGEFIADLQEIKQIVGE